MQIVQKLIKSRSVVELEAPQRTIGGIRMRCCESVAGLVRRLLLVLLLGWSVSVSLTENGSAQANAGPLRNSVFAGPIADHFLDRSGELRIDDVVVERNGAKFTPADGRVANYGPRPTPKAAFWLRLTVPKLDSSAAPEWVLTLNEPRTRRAVLYLPSSFGWSGREWLLVGPELGTLAALRYPTFRFAAADVSERTIFLRIETPSSLRALVWLQPQAEYVGDYAKQSTLFGILFGILVALCLYMFAIGLMTREGAYLSLSALIFANLCYVAGDRGFVEVVFFPGAVYAARVCSLVGTILTFAFSVAYAVTYLRVAVYFPHIAKLAWLFVLATIVVAAVAVDDIYRDISRARFAIPYFGFATYGLIVGLSFLILRRDSWRALAFLMCWLPWIAGSLLRVTLDAYPTIGAAPYLVNANYVASAMSFMLMAIVTSVDLQRREQRLRVMAEASEDRFRSFAGAATDAYWETDAQGQLLFHAGPAVAVAGLARGGRFADAFDLTDILDQRDRDYCIATIRSRWCVGKADVCGAGGR